jgi:hypothetical protein
MFGMLTLSGALTAYADNATLVDYAVMVNKELDQAVVVNRATYLGTGGYAVTSKDYIDAVGLSFDLGSTVSVAQATVRLPVDELFPINSSVPISIYAFADDGRIDLYDYAAGLSAPVGSKDIAGMIEAVFDVTAAVNAILQSSRYAGFRITADWLPNDIPTDAFPAFKGARFNTAAASLEFTPGEAPASGTDSAVFDGFRLYVPGINVPDVGSVDVEFYLTDLDNSVFTVVAAEVYPISGGSGGLLSGIELLDCEAFSPPSLPEITTNPASFSYSSGLLNVPNVSYQGGQVDMVLALVQDGDSTTFQLVSLNPSAPTPPLSTVSALGGAALIEPTQDFIPLCHGWVLIGDSSANRLLERNVITGEVAGSYFFNTQPDQLTLDDENNIVYFSTHPETERLYKLDLNSGTITYNRIIDGERQFSPLWLEMGENGNLFSLLHDRSQGESPASNGLWLGLLDSNADPVVPAVPLDSPVRLAYDNVQQRIFLTTDSNLATFDFSPQTNGVSLVSGTDIPVGSGCTDLAISPNGNRLAYACPNGNNEEVTPFAIHDLDPVDYHNPDGEWYLGAPPVSATFSKEGDMLIATDGSELFFFDVITHLLIEKYDIGKSAEEVVKKVRLSRDGDLLMILMANELDSPNGKIYWMPIPNISGTPIPW